MGMNGETRRTNNNRIYYILSLRALKEYPEILNYYSTPEKIKRRTILYHLGRLCQSHGPEPVIELATYIAENKISTSKAIEGITQYRAKLDGKPQENKIERLVNKITGLINNSVTTDEERAEVLLRLKNLEITE